jgi:hypothetical protein
MINLILHYLLALPDAEAPQPSQAEPKVSAARKRKSMDLATMMAAKVETAYTPLLFNLVDLIHSCLKSRNQQTICVTLQLLAVILKRHHRYAVTTLLHTEGVHGTSSHRTIGAHQQEVEFLMTLAGSVGGQDNFDEVYDAVLKDTMTRLEGHPCSLKLVAPKVSLHNHKLPAIPDSLPGAPRDVPHHTLSPEDPLLSSLLDIFDSFFVNAVETNLSLTETIIDLAVCGYISVEGWLLRHPHKYAYDDDEDAPNISIPDPATTSFAEVEKLQAMARCRRRPRWQSSTLPRALAILETLADQVVAFRSTIPRFEDLLQQRREAFQTADNIVPNQSTMMPSSKSATPVPDRTAPNDSRPASPRPSGLEGFAQRLLSELGSPNRSGSPRGRKEQTPPPSMSGGYVIATPTSKPVPPPKQFPLNHESPGRSGMPRSFSPGSQRPDSDTGGRDSPVASQMAAFAAIDQSILARRVSLPGQKVDSIPLDFSKNPDNADPVENEAADEGIEAKEDGEVKPEEETQLEGEAPPSEEESQPAGSEDLAPTPAEQKTVSVSHVLTNIIIFQSFLMELAALVQVRAGLFNEEVRFV